MQINCIILLLCLCVLSCTNKSTATKIIYLNKLERKADVNFNEEPKPGLYQYALIENPPADPDSLRTLILNYCDTTVKKSDIEGRYYRYFIQFFNRSRNTESYQKGAEDFWDVHNDISQEMEDYRGEYRFERCTADTLHGQWSVEVRTGDQYRMDTLGTKCAN